MSTKTTAKYFGDVYAEKNKLVFSTQKEGAENLGNDDEIHFRNCKWNKSQLVCPLWTRRKMLWPQRKVKSG